MSQVYICDDAQVRLYRCALQLHRGGHSVAPIVAILGARAESPEPWEGCPEGDAGLWLAVTFMVAASRINASIFKGEEG